MTEFIQLIVFLFFLHWVGDFICQTRWMADNKSKNLRALTYHVSTYALVLLAGLLLYYKLVYTEVPMATILKFVGVNFVLHWLTDITTSQGTKYFWKKQNIHMFFAVIGFDQMIHSLCLLLTAGKFLCSASTT